MHPAEQAAQGLEKRAALPLIPLALAGGKALLGFLGRKAVLGTLLGAGPASYAMNRVSGANPQKKIQAAQRLAAMRQPQPMPSLGGPAPSPWGKSMPSMYDMAQGLHTYRMGG